MTATTIKRSIELVADFMLDWIRNCNNESDLVELEQWSRVLQRLTTAYAILVDH